MNKNTARWLLLWMAAFCVVYSLPMIFGGFLRYEEPFSRYFLAFIFFLLFSILASLFAMDRLVTLDKKIRAAALNINWVLIGAGAVFVTGFILVFTMVVWNDEQSNLEAARYLWLHGLRDYFKNYAEINSWLGRHHPPLLVLFYALVYKATGFSLVAGRLVNLGFAVGATWVSYHWLKHLTDKVVAGLALVLFLLTPMWCFSSASALLDMPFLFLFITALYFFERFIQTGKARHGALAGLFCALAILSRYNGLFLFPIWAAQLLSDKQTRKLFIAPKTYLAFITPLILASPWLAVALTDGTFWVQFKRLSEFLLVAVVRPGGWWYLSEVLLPLFPIMMGIFNIPIQIYGVASCVKVNTPGTRRLLVTVVTYLALITLTLPNPRYVLPAVPMLSALSSLALWRLAAKNGGAVAVFIAGALCAAAFLVFFSVGSSMKLFYIFY